MSFSMQAKKEICNVAINNPCCALAASYGIACFAKKFDHTGLLLRTEQLFIAKWSQKCFGLVGVDSDIKRRNAKNRSYEFAVNNPFEVEKMLTMFNHDSDELALHILRENFTCEGCFSAFLSAAFLCGGTAPKPEKQYSLEFTSPRHQMMQDFSKLLTEHGFAPKHAERNGVIVIYFKASEQIEDLLTTMGATQSALEIMNLKVYKDFRNRVNRITNCETANIDKTVAANKENLAAIAFLEEMGAVGTMQKPLQETIRLRKENPDLSLGELAELFEKPVSKPGLSHRFRKIREKAAAIREKQRYLTISGENE